MISSLTKMRLWTLPLGKKTQGAMENSEIIVALLNIIDISIGL